MVDPLKLPEIISEASSLLANPDLNTDQVIGWLQRIYAGLTQREAADILVLVSAGKRAASYFDLLGPEQELDPRDLPVLEGLTPGEWEVQFVIEFVNPTTGLTQREYASRSGLGPINEEGVYGVAAEFLRDLGRSYGFESADLSFSVEVVRIYRGG